MTGTRIWALGAAMTSALLSPAPALASPDEPAPPPPAPAQLIPPPEELLPAIGAVMAQSGSQPTGPLGLPDLSGLGPNLILGQNPAPAAPGPTAPAAVPSLNAFSPEYLLGLNEEPAAPGEGTPAPGIGPTPQDPSTGRIAFLRRLREMYQDGALKGALLGQIPPEEFGEPLLVPPTAPPPG